METKHLFFGLLATLALAGCSSDDVVNTPSELISDGTPRYMNVSVVSNAEGATRADYEDGTDDENAFKTMRFYFFSSSDAAANVKADGTNYVDVTPYGGTGSGVKPNVEEIVNATIVISTQAGDQIPSKMMAVLNPSAGLKAKGSLSLSELKALVGDYANNANKNGVFDMVSSVYCDGGETVSTASVKSENICKDSTEAKNHPVEIYVERNVAKVALQFGKNADVTVKDGYQLVALKNTDGDDLTLGPSSNPTQVYLKVKGWDLTATTKNGYLSKSFDASWENNKFGTGTTAEPWNNATYFRSYWAQNVQASGADAAGINYYTYTQHKDLCRAIALNSATIDETNWKYTNENAGSTADGAQRANPTQVIVMGQLCDADGNALNVTEYLGAKYIDDADFSSLKAVFANLFGQKYYYKEGTTYYSMDTDDFEFVSVSEDADDDLTTQTAETGRYKVKTVLSEAGDEKNWFDEEGNPVTDEVVAADLATYKANVYKTGYTYYWFKIQHLNTVADGIGYYGVVRNHYYKYTINNIYGLGTPVYDPDKKVYPETPDEEYSYIAAKLNILSWRLVGHDIDLGR